MSQEITESSVPESGTLGDIGRRGAMILLAAALVLSPFPLGGAVNWGAPGIALLIGAACLFAALAAHEAPGDFLADLRYITFPATAALLLLTWIWLQTWPGVPASWTNPVWGMTQQLLQRAVPATISVNPWRTQEELLKLATGVAAFWVAFSLSRDAAAARRLHNIVIAAATFYALYGFVLVLTGTAQVTLIYGVAPREDFLTGPFMLHNSFATYCGIAALAAVPRLYVDARKIIDIRHGTRLFALNIIQFLAGRGGLIAAAALILLGALLGSASRAGFAATAAALVAVGALAVLRATGLRSKLWAALGMLLIILPPCGFLLVSDTSMGDRYARLLDAGMADTVRLAMWQAARDMISVFPFTGLGLGTFQDAYPLFAHRVLPFVIDKAHCDWLEFAAGVGLPAAILWWVALGYLLWLCLKGAMTRRRNASFALAGFGATVLVALHASVDFSLQIPAVALSYAILLGVGVAQARRSSQQ